jgi:hypothetical protein
MIIERCTVEHVEDWVRLRQALWPEETTEEEHRRYVISTIDRPKDAIAYVARGNDGNAVLLSPRQLYERTM